MGVRKEVPAAAPPPPPELALSMGASLCSLVRSPSPPTDDNDDDSASRVGRMRRLPFFATAFCNPQHHL